jgi:hypothetical protein
MDPALTTGVPPAEAFGHVRIIIGMILGLCVSRLLTGLARFIQHPGKQKIYPVHLAWVGFILLSVIHFWWFEFGLRTIPLWTFEKYLFVIFYAGLYFLLCTLLFPDSMEEYTGYRDYFISRRKWFFGILALVHVVDVMDTLLKGMTLSALWHGISDPDRRFHPVQPRRGLLGQPALSCDFRCSCAGLPDYLHTSPLRDAELTLFRIAPGFRIHDFAELAQQRMTGGLPDAVTQIESIVEIGRIEPDVELHHGFKLVEALGEDSFRRTAFAVLCPKRHDFGAQIVGQGFAQRHEVSSFARGSPVVSGLMDGRNIAGNRLAQIVGRCTA